MKQTSLQFKQALAKQFRDKEYATISLGVINQKAQASLEFGTVSYLSNKQNAVKLGEVKNTYASFEENQTRADGQYLFPPENDMYFQLAIGVGVVANRIGSSIRVSFDATYNIKGLTIDFGDSYPTEFTISNGTTTETYTLDNPKFTCTDVFAKSSQLTITPIHFVNGDNKRLRINYILMGVGIYFNNNDIESISLDEEVSYTSETLPVTSFSANILDPNKLFNVDDTSSFINYLEDGQPMDWSIGQTLDDGTVEFIEMPRVYLSDWSSSGRKMAFKAVGRIELLEGTYSAGNYIHERTLYDDAIAVLTDAGLEPDDYIVDTCLQDITVTNPLPTAKHKECLQLIANAGRCSFRESDSGKVLLTGNFENIIGPTDLVVSATGESPWSNVDNVRYGTDIVYADFTANCVPANGFTLFLPENSEEYSEDTTFVSDEISDDSGEFSTPPTITMELPARYTYYGLNLVFNGNHPESITIDTYYDDELLKTGDYEITSNMFSISDGFVNFNRLVFTFTKTVPYNRILVKQISLGDITDYRLKRFDMLEEPLGILDKKTKNVGVKIHTFNPPQEEGDDPELVEDSVFYVKELNTTGRTVSFANQLIGTREHAELVAKWLANYYANNIMYSVKYRGDPRLNASDIIYMDNETLNNLQVEVESLSLEFNGSMSGQLELRRATNMLVEE